MILSSGSSNDYFLATYFGAFFRIMFRHSNAIYYTFPTLYWAINTIVTFMGQGISVELKYSVLLKSVFNLHFI